METRDDGKVYCCGLGCATCGGTGWKVPEPASPSFYEFVAGRPASEDATPPDEFDAIRFCTRSGVTRRVLVEHSVRTPQQPTIDDDRRCQSLLSELELLGRNNPIVHYCLLAWEHGRMGFVEALLHMARELALSNARLTHWAEADLAAMRQFALAALPASALAVAAAPPPPPAS